MDDAFNQFVAFFAVGDGFEKFVDGELVSGNSHFIVQN
jgi:hypothetical protein